ncbi:hypothetical protein LB530_27705 [Mesorhizobium sp. CO1-1-3]|nr:hypothetical protein [Mesorhizobium sp. CO1-1-3]MBZ9947941.1 hypothetical protein [Mesorhizobium sp. BR1-1-11]
MPAPRSPGYPLRRNGQFSCTASEATANRKLLLGAMHSAGFKNYAREWRHLHAEPRSLRQAALRFPSPAG